MYAYAVASARDESPNLLKMLLTCRATVFSLMNSSPPIARLLLPAATSVSTSFSRGLSAPAALGDQGHAVRDASLQDQRVSLAEPRERRSVGIAEALRDPPRLYEARKRYFRVSLEQARQRCERPQPGLLDALTAALQDPPATGDPAHGRSQVAPEEKTERMPERTPCGGLCFASAQPLAVRSRPRVFALVVSPDHVRGNRKTLEILDSQLPLAMSRR